MAALLSSKSLQYPGLTCQLHLQSRRFGDPAFCSQDQDGRGWSRRRGSKKVLSFHAITIITTTSSTSWSFIIPIPVPFTNGLFDSPTLVLDIFFRLPAASLCRFHS
jgi:hypothetical protein